MYDRWRVSQQHWDPDAYLASRRTRLTALKWNQVTATIAAFVAEIVANVDARSGARLPVLDLGCGRGALWSALNPSVCDRIVGLDPSPVQLLAARSAFPCVATLCGVAESLPFADGSFSCVVLKSVLDQCFSPAGALREVHRVVGVGGCVVVSLPNRGSWYKRAFP